MLRSLLLVRGDLLHSVVRSQRCQAASQPVLASKLNALRRTVAAKQEPPPVCQNSNLALCRERTGKLGIWMTFLASCVPCLSLCRIFVGLLRLDSPQRRRLVSWPPLKIQPSLFRSLRLRPRELPLL